MVLEPMARLLELPRAIHWIVLRLAQLRLDPPDGREPIQHPLTLPGRTRVSNGEGRGAANLHSLGARHSALAP